MTIVPAAPALPPAGRKRKHRSLTIEVSACLFLLAKEGAPLPLKPTSLTDWLGSCLRMLGVDPTKPWEMQHEPPLAARPFDDLTYDYVPRENDYRFLRPMQTPEHKKVTKEVDRPQVDKTRRQGEGQARHREAMMTKNRLVLGILVEGDAHFEEKRDNFTSNYGRNFVRDGQEAGPPRKHVDLPGNFSSEKAKLRAVARAQNKKWPKGRPIQSRGFSSRPKDNSGQTER